MIEAPHRTGKPVEEMNFTGKCFPVTGDSLTFVSMPGSPHLYLPVFTDVEDLKSVLEGVTEYTGIKLIEDGQEFWDSVPRSSGNQEIRVIVDLRVLENGRVRYIEVFRD